LIGVQVWLEKEQEGSDVDTQRFLEVSRDGREKRSLSAILTCERWACEAETINCSYKMITCRSLTPSVGARSRIRTGSSPFSLDSARGGTVRERRNGASNDWRDS
jgi:hypothetical protein